MRWDLPCTGRGRWRGRALHRPWGAARWLVAAGGFDRRGRVERRGCVDSGERDRHRRRLAARDRLVLRARPCVRFAGAIDGEAFQHAGLGTDLNDQPWALISSFRRGNVGLLRAHEQRDHDELPDHGLDRQMHNYRILVDHLRARLLRGRCARRDASDADRGELAPGRQRHLRQHEHRSGRLATTQPVRLDGHLHVARARRR